MNGFRITAAAAMLAWILMTGGTAAAATPDDALATPPDDTRAMSQRVDELVHARWEAEAVAPADRSSDAEFHRRVYLDLCGLIPTVAESREFLADETPDKRARLIDALLDGPNYPTHLAGIWRRMLLPAEMPAGAGELAGFQAWLRDQFLANHRYDNLVADLLVTRGSASGMRPTLFYTAAALKPETLATNTSKVFLGVQIGCASATTIPSTIGRSATSGATRHSSRDWRGRTMKTPP